MRPGHGTSACQYLNSVRDNHKILFRLLYGMHDQYTDDFESIAEIAAYAEFYDLFEVIAPALTKCLLGMYDLWLDVKENCHFHIALAQKLRCEEVFLDAMRHYIGGGNDLYDLVRIMHFESEYAFKFAQIRDAQRKRIEALTEDVLALTLQTHVPDLDQKRVGPGKPVKTSFFSSPHVVTDTERVQGIAQHIFMQWLNHQRLGDKHWAYLREQVEYPATHSGDSDDDDYMPPRPFTHGVHAPSSFRNACTAAVEVSQTGKELTLFDVNVAEAFIRESSLPASPYTTLQVQEELKKLVNQMAALAIPLVAHPDYQLVTSNGKGIDSCFRHDSQAILAPGAYTEAVRAEKLATEKLKTMGLGTMPTGTYGYAHTFINQEIEIFSDTWDREQKYGRVFGENRYGMTAKDDSGIHYFTATNMDEGDVPWFYTEDPFKAYKIQDLRPASKKWLKALGVLDPADEVEHKKFDPAWGVSFT